MSFYRYEPETADTFPCLEAINAKEGDDLAIVLDGASDEQGLVFEQAANIFHETGKTPRQLAEENAKLRELCSNFLHVTANAINAGDWKVDGAADPDSLIREANKVL